MEIIIMFVLVAINAGLAFYLLMKFKPENNNKFINLEQLLRDEFRLNRDEAGNIQRLTREELNNNLTGRMKEVMDLQKNFFDTVGNQLVTLTKNNDEKFDKVRQTLDDKIKNLQEEISLNSRLNRNELSEKLKEIRQEVEQKLSSIQKDNNEKLEQMRATVDEKLHKTLETRLGESFKLVSERLEQVQNGLGEMKTLATGVGDLKKVLTNVKTRGNLGELQLEIILEQFLTPAQYEKNAIVKPGSNERVEFAIKLPGKDENALLLPIDSKFPVEDYQRLIDAFDHATSAKEIEDAGRQLEASVKKCAKDIRDKYINIPYTTDFAIMFLPVEGLYAEVLRRTGLVETLQRDFRISVAGPTNLVAFLNSLQMGFRTLAVEKRSGEVWALLSAVKSEFSKFGTLLDRTHKQLQTVSNSIENASKKSRTIERKLKNVQIMQPEESIKLLEENLNELIEITETGEE